RQVGAQDYLEGSERACVPELRRARRLEHVFEGEPRALAAPDRVGLDALGEPDLERGALAVPRAGAEDADPAAHAAEPAAQHAVAGVASGTGPGGDAQPFAAGAAQRDAPVVVGDDGDLSRGVEPPGQLLALQRRNELAGATRQVAQQRPQAVPLLERPDQPFETARRRLRHPDLDLVQLAGGVAAAHGGDVVRDVYGRRRVAIRARDPQPPRHAELEDDVEQRWIAECADHARRLTRVGEQSGWSEIRHPGLGAPPPDHAPRRPFPNIHAEEVRAVLMDRQADGRAAPLEVVAGRVVVERAEEVQLDTLLVEPRRQRLAEQPFEDLATRDLETEDPLAEHPHR